MSKNRNRHSNRKFSALADAFNQRRFPKAFQIPERNEDRSSIKSEIQTLIELFQGMDSQSSEQPSQEIVSLLKLFADVTTGIWRTKQKMIQPGTEQPYEEMRKAYRPLAATFDILYQAGLEIKDWTDTPYATGMIEKVIAFEPSKNVFREMVIETIKPTILYKGQLLQNGEIIVGIPEKNPIVDQSVIQNQ